MAGDRPHYFTHLECSDCGKTRPALVQAGLCECGRPLLARYDLDALRADVRRDAFAARASMWQWRPMLPLPMTHEPVSLGEGGTPIIDVSRNAAAFGLSKARWLIKDEGVNPGGSFKVRGLSAAVTMAHFFGAERLVIPTAGNAGGALAAYCARAGLRCRVLMPRDAPLANRLETKALGAELVLVDGLITECGKMARKMATEEGWYDVSTLKEPYRIEGKKTMGYELACQLDWRLPDVIVYPTGGGTGLIGMWKAFDEMEALGWIDSRRPRMVTVQAAGCAPVVHGFEAGTETAPPVPNAATIAGGLRVPSAVGDKEMLRILRQSGGTAVAVTDGEILCATLGLARSTGVFASLEGAAAWAALGCLVERGMVRDDETTLLFTTGSGLKTLDAFTEILA